jgi:hypothetical protein
MTVPDLIGVNKDWFNVSLTDSVNDPVMRRKILQRLNVIEREAQHTLMAVAAFKAELTKAKPFPSRTLPHTLKQLRDWVLSQVMSAIYITSMCEDFVTAPTFSDEILYSRAAREGLRQAVEDPDRRAWIHRRYSNSPDPGNP